VISLRIGRYIASAWRSRRRDERLGFQQTGRIPGGILVAGEFVDDVLMTLELA